MYKGKEECAGCFRSGEDWPRYVKNRLCHECEKIMNVGRARLHEDGIKYTQIRQHRHAFFTTEINHSIHEFLSALNNPTAAATTNYEDIRFSSGDNKVWYTIPTVLIEPMKTLFNLLDDKHEKIKKEMESLPRIKQSARDFVIQEERDRIFQEGVVKGRQLLVQLNNGEITLDDFDKRQKRE